MAYYFITSFAARENESYTARFHQDLVRTVEELTGKAISAAMCRGGVGSHRNTTSPVADAGVMVALCSELYYTDHGCGCDWSIFERRLSRVPAELRPAVVPARVLVRWQPADPPPGLPRAPVNGADVVGDYALIGQLGIMRRLGWDSEQYHAGLREIAAAVCTGHAAGLPALLPADRAGVWPAFPSARATVPRPAREPHRQPREAGPQQQGGELAAEGKAAEDAVDVVGPRVFLSYAHEDDGGVHAEQVRTLWLLLRNNNINARLDRTAAEQPQNWPLWMRREYQAADYVLVVASPAYKRRAEGTETPGVGEGVAWEAGLLREEVYRDPAGWHRRILRVVLPGGSREDLPDFLGGHAVTHYTIDPLTAVGAEKLLRYLVARPYETEPPLGPRPRLEPRGTTRATPASEAAGQSAEAREATGAHGAVSGPTAVQTGDNNEQTNRFGSHQ